jgi:hypothetical protein
MAIVAVLPDNRWVTSMAAESTTNATAKARQADRAFEMRSGKVPAAAMHNHNALRRLVAAVTANAYAINANAPVNAARKTG